MFADALSPPDEAVIGLCPPAVPCIQTPTGCRPGQVPSSAVPCRAGPDCKVPCSAVWRAVAVRPGSPWSAACRGDTDRCGLAGLTVLQVNH